MPGFINVYLGEEESNRIIQITFLKDDFGCFVENNMECVVGVVICVDK